MRYAATMDQRRVLLNRLTNQPTQVKFLEIDVRDLSGRTSVARYHLVFECLLTLLSAAGYDGTVAVRVSATVSAAHQGGVRLDLGTVHSHQPIFFSTTRLSEGQDRNQQRLELVLTLGEDQLQAVEDQRGAGTMTFTMRFEGVAHCTGQIDLLYANQEVTYDVPQSRWLELLGALRRYEVLTFNLVLPRDGGPEPARQAVVALRQAQTALLRRDYDEAVLDCRAGIKALTSDGDKRFNEAKWERTAGKEERFWRVSKDVLRVTHAAHHPEEPMQADDPDLPPEPIHFDRQDAEAVICLLAALIRQRYAPAI